MTKIDIKKYIIKAMNTHLNPNNEANSVFKVISVLFFVSVILMVGSILFETNPFEQKPIFDNPLKVNGELSEKTSFSLHLSEGIEIQRI